MINVIPLPAFNDNYIWLIHDTSSNCAAIVDPGDSNPVLSALTQAGIQPVAILITHHHPDHIGGVQDLLSHYDIPVFGPAGEAIPVIHHPLKEGDKVKIDDIDTEFEIIDVPGHTSGHIAYYGQGKLFIGDTLFMAGCGRLFEGTAAQMYQSLSKIMQLADDTEIYCAHEYTLANLKFAETVEPDNQHIKERIDSCKKLRADGKPTVPGSLLTEKLTNPFLRSMEASVISAARQHTGQDLNKNVDIFAAIRSWKDNF
jgi:hydroxyacylglutathione hydrolase